MGSCVTNIQKWKGPKMFVSQNISCLFLVVAMSVRAGAYNRRKRIGKVEESDVRRGSRGSVEDFGRSSIEDFGVEVFDVTDFDISDSRRRPRVEDGKESMKMNVVQNFATPRSPSPKESTKRRTIGSTSWSSWTFSREPHFNFPTRPRVKTEIPRSERKMPDELPVARIVIFPCQNEKLRCKK